MIQVRRGTGETGETGEYVDGTFQELVFRIMIICNNPMESHDDHFHHQEQFNLYSL